jgi:hypothetical protein
MVDNTLLTIQLCMTAMTALEHPVTGIQRGMQLNLPPNVVDAQHLRHLSYWQGQRGCDVFVCFVHL